MPSLRRPCAGRAATATQCKEGITFYVADVAGALRPWRQEPLHICFDGDLPGHDSHPRQPGGSIFLPFKGVGKDIDHDLTVTGIGAFKGEYKGKITSYTQDPGGDCKTCVLATVKIGADGTLTPATSWRRHDAATDHRTHRQPLASLG